MSTLQTSFLFAALSLVPNNIFRYLSLSLILAYWAIYGLRQTTPAKRLARLEEAIKTTQEILERARSDCERDVVELMRRKDRLRQYVHPSYARENAVITCRLQS